MAKTKSQIMKDYRERKKNLLGDKWLKSENRRVKGYYVPATELSKEKTKQRRERNRLAKQRSRNKQKLENNKCNEGESNQVDSVASTSTTTEDMYGVSSTTNADKLTVKLPFRQNNQSAKKRKSRALAKSYRRIQTLENRNKELLKKVASTRRQLLRLKEMKSKTLTPRSKVDRLLKQAKLRPESVPEVRKKLLFSECLTEEVKEASTKNKKHVIMSVISGRIVKKYRMSSMMEKLTGIDKRHGRSMQKKVEIKPKSILETLRQKIQSDIDIFMKREDNSKILPGKKDAVKVDSNKEKSQKYILNDYLHNLHSKFCAESNYSVSLSTFCRCRPKEVSLVSFTSRNVCLCSKHQNFSLKLRCLKNLGVCTCTSPDRFIEELNDEKKVDEVLEKITADKVKYQEWKRVKMAMARKEYELLIKN